MKLCQNKWYLIRIRAKLPTFLNLLFLIRSQNCVKTCFQMNFEKFVDILVLILSLNVFMLTCAPSGQAVFNNPKTHLNGTITVRTNPILGTYMIGQIRNIMCMNSTSATLDPREIAAINNCMLGITINNWRNDTNDTVVFKDSFFDREWRQTIFNMSNIKLPDIREILSGSYNPFPNLIQATTKAPITDASAMSLVQSSDTCARVGEVYNPKRDIFEGVLGFISPPGVIGK